ncbi:TolC family protein [Prevotella histicola]|uniref:Transporter n=1 Tax=Prevotella histicola JCM 15637 = DNF00424 TaxID=1236504 RepID=A0AAW3FEK2_9BACT|nr:TolC family protein [Prevotella histicola]KGF26038.1 transporter [Prevotella histicola JCM 15637 = DNF00424]
MGKRILTFIIIILAVSAHAQTLEECQQAAEKNYPVIKRYDLIGRTTELTVSNLQKEWLPRITASAQATYQNAVAAWPESIKSVYQRMGLDMKGLKKDQYKVGIDVQQTLYDGGVISSQKRIARQEGKLQEAQNDVNQYQLRQRVNEMYFSLLLLNEQIRLNDDVKALLLSSEKKLAAMVKGGTAATSDYENVMAERLGAEQQNSSLKAQQQMLQRLLSVFCGLEVNHLQKPKPAEVSTTTNNRPELSMFDSQIKLVEAKEKALNARLMPKLGLFAQGYYGYPGYNIFEDMMDRKWTLNGIVGIKMSWDLSAFYTHKNDRERLNMERKMAENAREVFLFNSRLDEIQHTEDVDRYQKMVQADEEIITLRTNVRKAAESKLAHGIIDVNSLLREINNENAAKAQQAIHEIDMLKEMYNLKYTNNE